ncbi:MAG: hypothetical protein VYD87_17220 [Pseudomonadota bacterium]|nr:hypothetical protein [Pseudomonadota bacterium]MEE3098819.1 hypothetical protein [Pseudomonadota bacterium]
MTARAPRPRPIPAPLDHVDEVPARVRQRRRASGTWRLWWEPTTAEREAFGFEPVELDPNRITWSLRQALSLNRKVEAARKGVTLQDRGGRTFSRLAAEYRRSPLWERLREATRRDYDTTLRRIEKKWGPAQVAAFTKPILREWYETLYRDNGKWIAQHDLRIMSIVLGYGELRGWLPANPAVRMKMETPPPRERVLSWEEFDALRAAAADLDLPGMALAIAVAWYQGQRQKDVIEARVEDFADPGMWRFERSKAKAGSAQKGAVLPIHRELAPLLKPRLAKAKDGEPLILNTLGDFYRADNFRSHFGRTRAKAAETMPSLGDVQFRDLRRSWAWWTREGGASDRDRADGMGNQSDKNVRLGQTYNPASAAGAARAVAAMKRPKKKGRGK